MRTRFPHTTGVELPRSGNGTCHKTISFVLQWSGRFVSAATPLPSDPRHAGQFDADADTVTANQTQEEARHRQVAAALYSRGLGMGYGLEHILRRASWKRRNEAKIGDLHSRVHVADRRSSTPL